MGISLLPRGSGGNASTFQALLERIAKKRKEQFMGTCLDSTVKLMNKIIATTPIDTGAAAGVTSNEVGSVKRSIYKAHPGFNMTIGNLTGQTGWQLKITQDKSGQTRFAIINPMWNSYLKFLELGIATPLPPAHSHWVYAAYQDHTRELKAELNARSK